MRITEASLRKIVREMLKEAASLTPSSTPAGSQTPTPAARQPRGNPTVMQIQKIIGAAKDGFWGQQTQTKFINFVQSKIDGEITLLSVDRGRQISANELYNWKDIASQIGYVGNTPVQKKFEPNINGLFEFLIFLSAAQPATTNPLAAPAARPITMEDEYFGWGQPGNSNNAYFTPPGVDDMSDMGPHFGQPVPHAAYFEQPNSTSTRRNVRRQPRKK